MLHAGSFVRHACTGNWNAYQTSTWKVLGEVAITALAVTLITGGIASFLVPGMSTAITSTGAIAFLSAGGALFSGAFIVGLILRPKQIFPAGNIHIATIPSSDESDEKTESLPLNSLIQSIENQFQIQKLDVRLPRFKDLDQQFSQHNIQLALDYAEETLSHLLDEGRFLLLVAESSTRSNPSTGFSLYMQKIENGNLYTREIVLTKDTRDAADLCVTTNDLFDTIKSFITPKNPKTPLQQIKNQAFNAIKTREMPKQFRMVDVKTPDGKIISFPLFQDRAQQINEAKVVANAVLKCSEVFLYIEERLPALHQNRVTEVEYTLKYFYKAPSNKLSNPALSAPTKIDRKSFNQGKRPEIQLTEDDYKKISTVNFNSYNENLLTCNNLFTLFEQSDIHSPNSSESD